MREKILLNGVEKVHFTGVLGVSTSALAKHLVTQKYVISGTDSDKNGDFTPLLDLGANVSFKHSASKVKGANLLVYSSAVNDKNPEIKYALRKKIPVVKRSELLGEILSDYKTTVAVSGSHGKTTATSMIADMLIRARKDPTVFVGGETLAFGNYRQGKGEVAVAEACEFQKNFLDIKSNVSVVLNIDNDHQDSFKDINDQVDAFNQFIKGSICALNVDDQQVRRLQTASAITFGVENNAVITAKNIKKGKLGYAFTAYIYGRAVGKVNLSVFGKHNVYNALATISVAEVLKIPFKTVKSALEEFKGVSRRNEFIGESNGAKFFADYAHHPKEIIATLNAYNENFGEYAVVFQPHTYSRTKNLIKEFSSAFNLAKELVIYKTYSAREKFDRNGSEQALYKAVSENSSINASVCTSVKELEKKIADLTNRYKTVIILGAGDIYRIAKSLVKKLG